MMLTLRVPSPTGETHANNAMWLEPAVIASREKCYHQRGEREEEGRRLLHISASEQEASSR